MFLFIRLLLAHFIGDFLLQFNRVFALKYKGLKGGLPHALLIVTSLAILSWPYLKMPGLWGFISFVAIIHLFQDSLKVSFGKTKYSFWFYLLDQFLHVALISTVLLTGLKNVIPPKNTGSLIVSLYNNDAFIIYLIAVIVATYNGFYLIRNFKNTFFQKPGPHYSAFEKWFGMLERLLIVTAFFYGRFFLLLIPVILLARPLVSLLDKGERFVNRKFASFQEMALSWIIASVTGVILSLCR